MTLEVRDNGERQYFVELLSFYFSSLRKKKKMKKRTHKYFFSVGSPICLYKSPVSIDYVEYKTTRDNAHEMIAVTRTRETTFVPRFTSKKKKKKKACENDTASRDLF